jgi:iron complex outermembrane receptor protein
MATGIAIVTARSAAFIGAAVTIAAGNVVCAQSVSQSNTAAASGVQAAASASASENVQLGEIVITAQRRSENIQNVPIAVTAISGEGALSRGVIDTSDLQQAVPDLVIARNANDITPFIRGIGSAIGTPNAENSVAIYVDGVYQPAAAGNLFDLNNIERVEVLKGPQSTLFGRNATGGVIQVVTKDPSQKAEMDMSIGYENYDTINTNAYIAGGITDGLSAGVAILYRHRRDGWGTNLSIDESTPGESDLAIRGKMLFDDGNGTQIRLAGNFSHSIDAIGYLQIVPGARNVLGQGYSGEYNTTSDFNQSAFVKGAGGSLTIDHDFGGMKVASISAYQNTSSFFSVDTDLSVLPIVRGDLNGENDMFSQEFHLLSPTASPVQWLAGIYLFRYHAGYLPASIYGLAFDPDNPQGGISQDTQTLAKSAALFGQATYPLTDSTNLTMGARETYDTSAYEGAILLRNTPIVVLPINGVEAHNSLTYTKPTWRVSLDQKLAPDVLGYVSYNRGFKSGSFALGANPTEANGLTPLAPYQPEKLDAFELGLKSELFERRVTINTAAFYYHFSNFQFQKVFGTNVITLNGPTAQLYGVEAELQGRVTNHLTLSASASYLHSQIGNFPGAPSTERDPVTGLSFNGPADFNAKGNQLPFAPTFTATPAITYSEPTEVGTFDLSGSLYYNDGSYTEIDNRLHIGSYHIVNASLLWTDKSNVWSIRLWGKNLTGAYYYDQFFGRVGGPDYGEPAAPRTYGITLRARM